MISALREKLIFQEEERQRIRAKLSYIHLVRINLLIDDYIDFTEAHKNITKAFSCCVSDDEHVELLSTMHSLLKEYASMKRMEMPLSKQILRNECGPIAEAHLGLMMMIMMLLMIITMMMKTIVMKIILMMVMIMIMTVVSTLHFSFVNSIPYSYPVGVRIIISSKC